jgi:hypothetical protein
MEEKMINKHCLEAFNNLEKIPYHPQEYFALGWNAAIDAMSAEFAKKWELDEISDVPFITQPTNESMEDKE